jgi:hypothetical protein
MAVENKKLSLALKEIGVEHVGWGVMVWGWSQLVLTYVLFVTSFIGMLHIDSLDHVSALYRLLLHCIVSIPFGVFGYATQRQRHVE